MADPAHHRSRAHDGGRDIYGFRPGVDALPVPLVVTDFDECGVVVDPGPPSVVGERRMLFGPGDARYFMNNTTTWDVTVDDQTFR